MSPSAPPVLGEHARLLDAAPDAMIVVDELGCIVRANAQVHAVFGYDPADLEGEAVEVLVPPEARSRHRGEREAYATAPRVRGMGAGLELSGVRKDGSRFPVEVSLSPVVLGGRRFVIAAVRDLTERKQREAEARRQFVARSIVRLILRHVTVRTVDSAPARRELGRTMASETDAVLLDDYLGAFEVAGIGSLRVVEEGGGRFTFVGEWLIEVTPGARVATCNLTLGYLEGVLNKLHQRMVLGTEIACRSQGRDECRFVVSLRDERER